MASSANAVAMNPTIHHGQRAPGLRFGEPRTMALLASIAAFAHVMVGSPTSPCAPRWPRSGTRPTLPPRPPTTCGGSASRASSNASSGPTPTPHHPRAAHRCLLQSTGGSGRHPRAYRPRRARTATPPGPHALTAAWRAYEHQLTHSSRPASPLDAKLASSLQNLVLKRG
jgi:hypothetical protein